MGFSAFQHSAYQRNAYQIQARAKAPAYTVGGGSPTPQNYDGAQYSYERTKQVFEARQQEFKLLQAKKREIEVKSEEKEQEIARLEQRRADDLSDKFFQKQILRLFEEAQNLKDQQLLVGQRMSIILREDDDIMAILMTLPFSGY